VLFLELRHLITQTAILIPYILHSPLGLVCLEGTFPINFFVRVVLCQGIMYGSGLPTFSTEWFLLFELLKKTGLQKQSLSWAFCKEPELSLKLGNWSWCNGCLRGSSGSQDT